MSKYIYQNSIWPHFTWNEQEIQVLLGKVRHLQGKLFGQVSALGFSIKEEARLSALTLDVLKSSEIEGENLSYEQVRSSVARRLGIAFAGMTASGRDVEGVVDMMLDATQNYLNPLDENRLFDWHAALFPTGRSGMRKIETGRYRAAEMQVVSGTIRKEKVHFQAPPPDRLEYEMSLFLNWFNSDNPIDLVVKAAIAHFWFVIVHPFDDGNGRIARAMADMLLARSESSPHRFYSMSSQILVERNVYYEILQKVQHSEGDITGWLTWFLNCLYRALQTSEVAIQQVLYKAQFWDRHNETLFNARQRLMLNRLLDGFEGKLKSSKWARLTKCSNDTALRDIKDLIEKGVLKQVESGGRSTNYELVEI